MVITALTRNQVYRQRYRGFESHPLRQKKAHPPGWAFFWHYDPGAGGIRKAALGGMRVACRNRRGFSAEKGSHPLRQLVANYAGSRRLFYAAHEKVISYLLRCSSLQNRDRFAGSRFCFCGRDRPRCSRKKPIRMDGLFWCCGAGGGRWSGDSAAERLHRCSFLVEEVVDDVEQVDGVELLGGAEPGQTLDGSAVVGEGRDDREGRPAAALPPLAKKTV